MQLSVCLETTNSGCRCCHVTQDCRLVPPSLRPPRDGKARRGRLFVAPSLPLPPDLRGLPSCLGTVSVREDTACEQNECAKQIRTGTDAAERPGIISCSRISEPPNKQASHPSVHGSFLAKTWGRDRGRKEGPLGHARPRCCAGGRINISAFLCESKLGLPHLEFRPSAAAVVQRHF